LGEPIFLKGQFMSECRNMGLGNLGRKNTIFKRKFRWMFEVPDIVGEGINMYPPSAAARPKLTFNDFQVNHLVETITIPGRPIWNPITITVYDIVYDNSSSKHPIYEWILSLYGKAPNFPYQFSGGSTGAANAAAGLSYMGTHRFKKPYANITMYDGCGTELERWVLENVWPSEVDFGELDYSSSEVSTITMTLKYDRAYLEDK
jgi:hypothetical protein